jgi:hypothetical protein
VHRVSEIANQLPTDTETLHALVMTAWTQRDAAMADRDTAIGERDRALSQIDRQKQLVAIKLLRTPAELGAAQLAKQMAHPIDITGHPAIVHSDVAAVGPAKSLERLAERRGEPLSFCIIWTAHPNCDLPQPVVLLRTRRQRPSSPRTERTKKFAPPHVPLQV